LVGNREKLCALTDREDFLEELIVLVKSISSFGPAHSAAVSATIEYLENDLDEVRDEINTLESEKMNLVEKLVCCFGDPVGICQEMTPVPGKVISMKDRKTG